jgi:membrane protein implicated in regulation of membrane protease activity
MGCVADWLIWLIAAGALVVAETLSLGLVLIMFAGGALVAGGVAALGLGVGLQVLVFAIAAVGLLLVVRPIARRHLENTKELSRTGIEALVGRTATVLRTVDAQQGRVKIGGDEWSAQSYDATQVLEVGRTVRVMEINGVTAVVWGEP